jgi:flagellar biogenesis protein FliO
MKVQSITHAAERETRSVSRTGKPLLHGALALWRQILRISQRQPRNLRLCESLPLGDRRFVAVVEYERSRFLVGGTASSLVLLARIGEECADQVHPGVSTQPAPNEEQRW